MGVLREWVGAQRFLDYYRLHVIYMFTTTIVAAVIVFGIESADVAFTDCWFTTASAMTVTGLGVVDFTAMHRGTKTVVWLLICMGGQVAFALVPLLLRSLRYRWQHRREGASWWQWELSENVRPEDLAELKAIGVLAAVVLGYGLFFTITGIVLLTIYCYSSEDALETLRERDVEPWAFAIFHTVSAFNNAGFSLFADSLIPFQSDVFIVLVSCVLIAAGNTLLPVIVRATLVVLQRKWTTNSDTLSEIVAHPRKFTTHVFSAAETRWLLLVWVATTTFQFVLYTASRYEGELAKKALDMFFTTISTRTAGFNIVNFEKLQANILVLQVLLMYLSSYPFIVAVKSTGKVKLHRQEQQQQEQEEQQQGQQQQALLDVKPASLELDGHEVVSVAQSQEVKDEDKKKMKASRHVALGGGTGHEVKRVLSSDLLWLALVTWLIAAAEPQLDTDTLYRLIWEVTSAFGNIGISLARPTDIASFAGSFSAAGKLFIIATMLAGRHRGMPRSLDAAVATIAEPKLPQRRVRLIHSLRPGQQFHTVGHARQEKRPAVESLFVA